MPITPFIGVRISWLMLARKSDLSRDASVALSRASDIAASAPASAVTSARVPTQPATPPSPSGIDFEVTSTIRGGAPGTCDLESVAELGPTTPASASSATRPARVLGADDRVPLLSERLVGRDAGDLASTADWCTRTGSARRSGRCRSGAASVSSRNWSADACTSRPARRAPPP